MEHCDSAFDTIDDDMFDAEEGNFNRNGILYVLISSSDGEVTEEFDIPAEEVLKQYPDQIYQQMVDQTTNFHLETRPTSFATVARAQLGSNEQPKRQEVSDYNQLRVTEPELWGAYEDLYGDKLSRVKRIIEEEIIHRADFPLVDIKDDYPALSQYQPPSKKSSKLKHQQRLWRYIYCFIYTSFLVCLYINQIPNKHIRL